MRINGYSKTASLTDAQNAKLSLLTWSRWLKPSELQKTKNLLSKELTAANQIHSTEKAVTSELTRLRELGVYPTAELALIRRQFKSLEKEWLEKQEEIREENERGGRSGSDRDRETERPNIFAGGEKGGGRRRRRRRKRKSRSRSRSRRRERRTRKRTKLRCSRKVGVEQYQRTVSPSTPPPKATPTPTTAASHTEERRKTSS